MRTRTWTYTGNISSYSTEKNLRGEWIISETVLYDIMDDTKAPVMLNVGAGLMNYIMDIENHDDEERYMRKEFVYDSILTIREIRILNKDGKTCKIIRDMEDINWTAEITGPVHRITDENQPELSWNATALMVGPEYFKD